MIAVCAEVVGDMIGKLAAQVPGELFFSLYHDMGFFSLNKDRAVYILDAHTRKNLTTLGKAGILEKQLKAITRSCEPRGVVTD